MFHRTREKSPFYLLAVDFGYTLLAAVGVFGFLGYWVDNRYGTTPWVMIGGIGLGIAVGFNSLFRRLKLQEEIEKAAKKSRSQPEEPKPRR